MVKNRASRPLRKKLRARDAISAKTTRAYRKSMASEPERRVAAVHQAKRRRYAIVARGRLRPVQPKPFLIGGEGAAAA